MHYVVRHEINQREDNEDSFQVLPLLCGLGQSPLVMLAIADGMGGHAHGEHVSHEALRRISLGLMDALCVSPAINQGAAPFDLDPEALAKALYGAFHQANDYIRRMVESNQWGKAGTTIVVALIVGDRVVVGNLGDSPLLHYAASSFRRA
jgi:protein phosphatase